MVPGRVGPGSGRGRAERGSAGPGNGSGRDRAGRARAGTGRNRARARTGRNRAGAGIRRRARSGRCRRRAGPGRREGARWRLDRSRGVERLERLGGFGRLARPGLAGARLLGLRLSGLGLIRLWPAGLGLSGLGLLRLWLRRGRIGPLRLAHLGGAAVDLERRSARSARAGRRHRRTRRPARWPAPRRRPAWRKSAGCCRRTGRRPRCGSFRCRGRSVVRWGSSRCRRTGRRQRSDLLRCWGTGRPVRCRGPRPGHRRCRRPAAMPRGRRVRAGEGARTPCPRPASVRRPALGRRCPMPPAARSWGSSDRRASTWRRRALALTVPHRRDCAHPEAAVSGT